MEKKTVSIGFRLPSAAGEYMCEDGEVAATENLEAVLTPAGVASGEDAEGDVGEGGDEAETPGDGDSSTYGMELPPLPEIEWSLKKTVLPGWHTNPDTLPGKLTEGAKSATEDGWGVVAGELLEMFQKETAANGLHIEPFMAVAAWRLTDGSHVMATPPVMLTPNSEALMVEGATPLDSDSVRMNIAAAVCRLQWRMKKPEGMEEWHGRVTHLDIFTGEPLPLYERGGKMTAYHRIESGNMSHCERQDGTAMEHRVSTSTFPLVWAPEATTESDHRRWIAGMEKFYLSGSVRLSRLEDMPDFVDVEYNEYSLSQIGESEAYRPDYAHLSVVKARGKSSFSGRDTLFDLEVTPPAYRKLQYSAQYTTATDATPRFLFHPDPEAASYGFTLNGKGYAVGLRQHPQLYGSYHFTPFSATPEPGDVEEMAGSVRNWRSVVWRSGKGSRLFYPDSLMMELDVRRVIGICRAFRASGLVATTAPTAYLFTDEGIFLLREQEDGTFKDAGLMATYVLRDSRSYRVKGKTVEFVTEEGERMVIEGTTVKPLLEAGGEGTPAVRKLAYGDEAVYRGTGGEASLVTRALKLGEPEARKRVMGVVVRGDYNPGDCEVTLEGSDNLREWRVVARRRGAGIIRGLWTACARFFRVRIKARLASGETLEGIAVEIKNEE